MEKAHTLEAEEALKKLDSDKGGLSSGNAEKRLEETGPNRLPESTGEGLIKRFFKHFNDILIYILMAAAFVTAILGHWVDTGVILGVIIVNALIGFIQEGKAEEALAGIRKMLSLKAYVLRDGAWNEMDADLLVPGDIVRLKSGDKVPADLRLLEAVNLRIEESALTGESVPTDKGIEPVDEISGVGDRSGMAYSGTMVTAGRGLGVVTATGSATELGRINTMISEVETLDTPLTIQMKRFGRILSLAIVGLAIIMGITGRLLHGLEAGELFLAAIGFAVAAIPEGLPAILTITLALGVKRMAGRNAITRKLNAVETLGSVTVICSDKTGTLTRNEMTVVEVTTPAGNYEVSGGGYEPKGGISMDGSEVSVSNHEDLQALLEVMEVCNDSEIREEEGRWSVIGEPTEGALRTLAAKAEFDSSSYKRIASIPFESENKFMATLNTLPDGGRRIMLKGAPDRLMGRCSYQRNKDGSSDTLDRSYWEERIEELAGKGLRVLAAACRDTGEETEKLSMEDVEEGMVFLGLTGIIDPPRPEAIEAVAVCKTAGIRVIMITGDHASTASAIGKKMGIGDGEHAVTGEELERTSDEDLKKLVKDICIFARTSPEHKLRLVRALQALGEVTAMTGDGVNDAPALKRADVGVAMGIKGTEATKEAADIVLTDDNFTSIEQAIEEGRTIYDNLRKAILFILPTNGAEALVILAAVILGITLPLIPVQILWVNMVTAVTLALALAFEPSEPDIMKRPPRKSGESILGGSFILRLSYVSIIIGGATIAVFLFQKKHGIELARTQAVNTLVFGQIFYLFNSRYLRESGMKLKRIFTNPVAWLMVGILLVLQALFVYAPFMHLLFSTAPMEASHWLPPLYTGIGVYLIVEGEKAIERYNSRRKGILNEKVPGKLSI